MPKHPDIPDERRDIELAQAGDEAAFERLMTRYEVKVYRLAFSMLRHKQDAEDAMQETFIKLWRVLPTYRFECSLLVYLLKITRTVALDLERRRQRVRSHEESMTVQDDNGEWVEREVRDEDESSRPDVDVVRKERIAMVREAIEELSDEHRQIILLKDIQGLSYAEIGSILNLEAGTVASRLSRAREHLKKILKMRKIF